MEQQAAKTTPVTRVVMILVIVALLGMIGYGVLYWRMERIPVIWDSESFDFASGPQCYVFIEPKLTIFIGDEGTDEVFDRINECGQHRGINVNRFVSTFESLKYDNVVVSSYQFQDGTMTMRYLDGKFDMVVSHRGTKLTLADGREFKLDGKTPLWLRCKTDGTIVSLDELPNGFVEFFESPPPDPGNIGEVTSYPEAFVK